jgi:hypothetical protein
MFLDSEQEYKRSELNGSKMQMGELHTLRWWLGIHVVRMGVE